MSESFSDPLFQSAFEYAAIGIALVSPEGRWLQVNRSLCQFLGYSAEELRKLTFQDLTHPEDLNLDLEYVARVLKGEIESYQLEKRYIHRNGSLHWGLLSVSLVRTEAGQPRFFISQVQDVTARKKAEGLSETLFRLPVALHYAASFDGYFRRLSVAWPAMLGYSMEELLAKPYVSFVHPDDQQRTLDHAARVARGSGSNLFENRYRHADGQYRWLLWSSIPVQEEEMFYGVAIDYTQRKEMQLKLEQSFREKERLYEELQESTTLIRKLREGLLTVCAWTKRVQHEGRWMPADEFLSQHLHLNLTHGISEEGARQFLDLEKSREKDRLED